MADWPPKRAALASDGQRKCSEITGNCSGKWLAGREVRFADVVGRAADALVAYGEQADTPGRWRDFVQRETIA